MPRAVQIDSLALGFAGKRGTPSTCLSTVILRLFLGVSSDPVIFRNCCMEVWARKGSRSGKYVPFPKDTG